LLRLGRAHGHERLREAIEKALNLGCQDSAAVRHLLTSASLRKASAEPLELEALAAFSRPLPSLGEYDELLVGGGPR